MPFAARRPAATHDPGGLCRRLKMKIENRGHSALAISGARTFVPDWGMTNNLRQPETRWALFRNRTRFTCGMVRPLPPVAGRGARRKSGPKMQEGNLYYRNADDSRRWVIFKSRD